MLVLLIIIMLFLLSEKSFFVKNSFNVTKFFFDSDLDAVLFLSSAYTDNNKVDLFYQ